jgi:hypothetical protein
MQGQVFKRYDGARLSARASITLWLVLAGMVWVTVGFAVSYLSSPDDGAPRAQAGQLSKIVPAAGGASPDRR